MSSHYPTITAIMVTRGCMDLVAESYRCFKTQTYPVKKLLIVTNGREKEEIKNLARKDKDVLALHVAGESPTLGELRNASLIYASRYSIQWDDDDWYGPTRMADQWKGLVGGAAAVMLTEQLHYFRDTAQVGWTLDPTGIEGTILFDKSCDLRYPLLRRGEDTALKAELRRSELLTLVAGGICYCRTYHGANTWDHQHHIDRVRALGKSAQQLEGERDRLRQAARLYRWRADWRPIIGVKNRR